MVCGRVGFLRLPRHLSQIHKMGGDEYCALFPGSILEVPSAGTPKCASCGVPVEGYSPRAANVKCEECRTTPTYRKKGAGDPKLVTCCLCGLSRKRLGEHLENKHSLTPAEYTTAYPGALVGVPGTRARSEGCKEKMRATAKIRWASPGEREAQSTRLKESAPWKGKHLGPRHRGAISLGGTGVPHTLTSEQRRQRGMRGKQVLGVVRQQPGHSESLSQGQKSRRLHDPLVGFSNPETRRKSLTSRIKNGTLAPQGSGRGICGFRVGIPHYCRSTLEANFARVLTHFKVRYNYEPKVFKLASGSIYIPDFYLLDPIPELGVPAGWVELKGWRKADGTVTSQAKIGAFVQEYGSPIVVIAERDPLWVRIQSEVGTVISLWERPGRNLRTHPRIFGPSAFLPIPTQVEHASEAST